MLLYRSWGFCCGLSSSSTRDADSGENAERLFLGNTCSVGYSNSKDCDGPTYRGWWRSHNGFIIGLRGKGRLGRLWQCFHAFFDKIVRPPHCNHFEYVLKLKFQICFVPCSSS